VPHAAIKPRNLEEAPKMLTLTLSLRATKRLYFHQVTDEQANLLFTSKRADECFVWLWEGDQHEFWLSTEGGRFHVTMAKPLE
jgi:hypothetical protein